MGSLCAAAAAVCAAACCFAGCFPVAQRRHPQSVAAALAGHPMRSVESEHLRLYFPDGRQAEARRFLSRVEGCAAYLTRAAQVHNSVADQKMIVILPELPYNNAFVAPRVVGYDTEAVIPTFNTTDFFAVEMGAPPDPAQIACHELTHYVQFQQIAGFAWFWNALFGAVYTPQIGLDAWFDEGLAVYYESKLIPRTGRLASPFWRGAFAAAFAGRRINGGDLHVFNRDFHAGNHYLVGGQFVRFLADRYGEDKLWKLVEVQARSIFFPLWVNVRFWQAYDKSLSTLIDEFADEVEANLRPRARPPAQRVVRDAGNSSRYARADDGTEAMITQAHDSPARLTIHGPDGRMRVERNLTDVVPPRRLAVASATRTSGLSFTADGRFLYFVAIDIDATYQVSRLFRADAHTGKLELVNPDLRGTGGGISGDGTRYLFAQANGDHHDLAVFDVGSGAIRVLSPQGHGAYVTHPRVSPDGKRVVAIHFEGSRARIVVFDAFSGAVLGWPSTGDGPVSDPSWVDDQRLLFLGTEPAYAGFQIYLHELGDGRTQRLTDAPYLAFQPRPAAATGTVRFLNREGWGWTLDEVALPPRRASIAATVVDEAAPAAAVVEAEATSVPAVIEAEATPAAAVVEAEAAAPAPAPSPPADDQSYPLADRRYSQLDHLFVPLLHGPTIQSVGRRDVSLGLVLSGNDRLSLHRWTLGGSYQAAGGGALSMLVGYSNSQLAPVTLTILAAQVQIHDVPPAPPGQPAPVNPPFTLFRRDRLVSADATRLVFDNPISLGGVLIESYRPGDPDVVVERRRFVGPSLYASFTGVEATPYTGARRLFSAAGAVAAYPRAWNTVGFGFVDARAQLDAVVPVPASWGLGRRHSFSLGGRARSLIGAPRDQPLLLVGGYSNGLLGRRSNRPEVRAIDSPLLPPGISFVEPLRGFEDYPLLSERIFIGDAGYRYPFIIDRGTASTLGLLPAFFVSQIDLEFFGSFATTGRGGDRHVAAGGALTLRLGLWLIPFGLQYQVARRVTDDRGLVHLITLAL